MFNGRKTERRREACFGRLPCWIVWFPWRQSMRRAHSSEEMHARSSSSLLICSHLDFLVLSLDPLYSRTPTVTFSEIKYALVESHLHNDNLGR